jgi:hypothetical protein
MAVQKINNNSNLGKEEEGKKGERREGGGEGRGKGNLP